MERTEKRYWMLGVLTFALATLFSTGFHHWDEHFQILEFAFWKLGHTSAGDLPWEFAARMRPALQPAIVVVAYRFFCFFGEPDPFVVAWSLRALSALLSLLGCVLLVRASKPLVANDRLRAWLVPLSLFLWFFVYNGVRFSSEGWSASLFCIGFALLVGANGRTTVARYALIGALFGLSFVVRPQCGAMIGGALLWSWIMRRDRISRSLLLLIALVGAVGCGVLVDRWFYGEWVFTLLNYYEQNLVAGKAAAFGTEPWWNYFEEVFVRAVPPFSLVLILCPLVAFVSRWRDPFTWAALPFVLLHTLIGHKEIRFLFPMIGLLPMLIVRAFEWWKDRSPEWFAGKVFRYCIRSFWVVNCCVLLVVIFKPADAQIPLYTAIYHRYSAPTTLFYTGDDPYDRVARIHFYRREDLHIHALADTASMGMPTRPFLVATREPRAVMERWPSATRIYSSLPEWVKYVDLNGWVERTDQWYVLEVPAP